MQFPHRRVLREVNKSHRKAIPNFFENLGLFWCRPYSDRLAIRERINSPLWKVHGLSKGSIAYVGCPWLSRIPRTPAKLFYYPDLRRRAPSRGREDYKIGTAKLFQASKVFGCEVPVHGLRRIWRPYAASSLSRNNLRKRLAGKLNPYQNRPLYQYPAPELLGAWFGFYRSGHYGFNLLCGRLR